MEYKLGHQKTAADALSRAPVGSSPVCAVTVDGDSNSGKEPVLGRVQAEQRKNSELDRIIKYFERAELPGDFRVATQIASRANQNYFFDRWCVVF